MRTTALATARRGGRISARLRIGAALAGIGLAVALGGSGGPARAAETNALLFREGVLDTVAVGGTLRYEARRSGRAAAPRDEESPDTAPADIRLDLTRVSDSDAELTASAGDVTQRVGSFPAKMGNPVVMYFLETILRDMASQAGGSPFYIRNRIKESLSREAEVRAVEVQVDGRAVAAQEVIVRPFASDAARDRMQGFADLALTAVVSDQVPGWYVSLAATAPAPAGSGLPGYSNTVRFVGEATK